MVHEHLHGRRPRVLVLGPWETYLVRSLEEVAGAQRIDCWSLGADCGERSALTVAGTALTGAPEPESYDAIFTQGFLAAAAPLPDTLDLLQAALTPGGLLVCEDWTGAPNLEPSPQAERLLGEVRAILPRGLFASSSSTSRSLLSRMRRIGRDFRRRLISRRAARWLPAAGTLGPELTRRFEVLVERPYGGGLVDGVMAQAGPRFDPAADDQMAVVELLCLLEQELLEAGLLPPTWTCFLLRRA